MSRQRKRSAAGRQEGRRRLLWPLAGATALAIFAVAVLVAVGQRSPAPAGPEGPVQGTTQGSPSAAVEVVEWGDFQCPACRQYALGPERELKKTYVAQGKVRIVWRHLAFLGPESVWAAEASQCAADQGRFWEYHDKLFAEQAGENRGAFSKSNLKRFAAQLGLDAAQFDACLDSDRHAGQVQQEKQTAQLLGVAVTPTLFVNGTKIEGVPTWDQLSLAIESATAESGR